MRTRLLNVVRVYVVFVALAGFLFGQVFSGHFAIPAAVAGVFGMLAGVLPPKRHGCHPLLNGLVLFSCVAGVAGVAADAHHYYKYLDVPGNSYAWFLIGPFVLGLCMIAISRFAKPSPDKTS